MLNINHEHGCKWNYHHILWIQFQCSALSEYIRFEVEGLCSQKPDYNGTSSNALVKHLHDHVLYHSEEVQQPS